MESLFYIVLFVFGTLFGSFASVIIYRIKSWEMWIITWRSHCNSCNNTLKSVDLVPIFSHVINKWVCRYCRTKVSSVYPTLEFVMWMTFFLIWYFLIDFNSLIWLDIVELYKLWFFLIIWFFTIIFTFYDILFLEIPESILGFGTWLSMYVLFSQTMIPWINIIENWTVATQDMTIWISAVILSLCIILGLYTIMLKWLKEIWDILILIVIFSSLFVFKYIFDVNLSDIAIFNWLMWALWIYTFFFIQIVVSWWARMWWWDLRIAIFMWLVLWSSLSFPWVMITYFIWSIIWIWLILYSKIKHRKLKWKTTLWTRVPFGPFLAAGFLITIFFQNEILQLMKIHFY